MLGREVMLGEPGLSRAQHGQQDSPGETQAVVQLWHESQAVTVAMVLHARTGSPTVCCGRGSCPVLFVLSQEESL